MSNDSRHVGRPETERPFRELDELVLRLKGLVLVHKLRRRANADAGELGLYSAEIARIGDRLAQLARDGGVLHAS